MKNIMLCAALAAFLFCGCNGQKTQKQEGHAEYKTMQVETSDFMLHSRYTATMTGRQIVEVRPQVSGRITRICIREGERVRRGQTLFVIDQVPYQMALKVASAKVGSARAQMETARLNYESEVSLQSQDIVSDFTVRTTENKLREAEAALRLAEAEEANARNSLSYTEVQSPVSGAASMIPYHVGALVSSSIAEPLVTVADDSEMWVYFSITESQALDLTTRYGTIDNFIKNSPELELELSNGTLYPLKGRIDAVSGTVEGSTGAVSIRAVFQNPDGLLRNGGSAVVVLPTERKNCIVVPQEATMQLQNRYFVYKIVDGKTVATPVDVYPSDDGKHYIIENGLHAGDIIIAEGAGLMREGVEVNVGK